MRRLELSGQVLGEFADWTSPLGLVYCRGGADFGCSFLCARPSLVFARCHSVFEGPRPGEEALRLDSTSVLLVPHSTAIELRAVTGFSHLAILSPARRLLSAAASNNGIPSKELAGLFGAERLIKRNNWLNEIMHRFVFERVEMGRGDNPATVFLSEEIVKETYFLSKMPSARESVFNLDATGLYDNVPVLKRALDYIETHLFSELSMAELSRNSFASEATLLRVFSREFSKPPFAYIADRRMEEALALLSNSRYSVGEVADLVAYKSVSGFISAFRRKFGCTPMLWRRGRT